MSRCTACEAHTTATQVVFGSGSPKARIMSIGEAPGPTEDAEGLPFVGRAGTVYDQLLKEASLDRERDLYTTNTVKCFPGRDSAGKIQKPSQALWPYS